MHEEKDAGTSGVLLLYRVLYREHLDANADTDVTPTGLPQQFDEPGPAL